MQRQEIDQQFHPVMFFSKKTTTAEAKLHSFELETLAVIYSIQRFRIYLFGIPFKIITDCNALKTTLEKRDVNPKISRWALFLEQYEYEIIHRSGDRMRHVDALSRCYSMENSVLYKFHNEAGHFGRDKVTGMIGQTYWIPGLSGKLKQHISSCIVCIHYNPKNQKYDGQLQNIEKPEVPFAMVHVDHLGPLETTRSGNRYIFLICDSFTKFIKLYATKTTNTKEVNKYLKSYILAYSSPRVLVSDRGTCFTSENFRSFTEEYGIQHILNATACPKANGQ
uniref:RNA-directed DNA polymerase n=1 Tax=Anopheles dirus TaxID=7168 RepID=A0A182N8D0_9DIPT